MLQKLSLDVAWAGTRRIFVAGVFCVAFGAVPAGAADPFYEQLLRDGLAAYIRGDHAAAQKDLRIAVFGFLDEPALLANGLCLLGLTQAAQQDMEGFRATFLRLADIEQRFQAYSKATIAPDVQNAYERLVAQAIPETTLKATPAFLLLIDLKIEERVLAMPVKARRAELERLVSERPGSPRWLLLLARQSLVDGREDEAISSASRILARDPKNDDALLVRGLACGEKGRWAEAVKDLVASGKAADSSQVAEMLLRAYMELEQWDAAARFARTLSPTVRANAKVADRVRRIDERARAAAPQPSPKNSPESIPKGRE